MAKKILDKKDRLILNELDMNARQSFSQIAKKTGLAKDSVQYRIKNLERRNIIEGYFTVINTARLGFTFYRVCLKFQNISLTKEEKIIEQLKKHSSIGWISKFNGRWDAIIAIWAKNIVELEEILSKIFADYEQFFQEKVISTTVYIYHFKNKVIYDLRDASEILWGGKIEETKIDDTDIKILSLLSQNARTPTIEIADKLKISANAVKNRIKKLIENKIILGFRAKLNEKLLGFHHHKIFLHLQNNTREKEKELIAFLKNNEHVIYITKAIGIAEIEFEILVKTIEEFYEIINEIRKKLGDVFKGYESVLVYEEKHINYLPQFRSP